MKVWPPASQWRRFVWWVLSGVGAGLTLAVGPAWGANLEPASLSFRGAPGCNDDRALEREIERRSQTVSWAPRDAASYEVTVTLVNRDQHFESHVAVERKGQLVANRSVVSSSCMEVLEATALIIAVVLPQAPEQEPAEDVPPEPEPASRWFVGGGTAGTVLLGISPGAAPGFGLFADVGVDTTGWAPMARLGFRHLRRSDGFGGGGRASFRFNSGVAALCPAVWSLGDAWRLRPCATTSYGVLEARGENTSTRAVQRHPWAGIGGGLRLEAPLLRTLHLELEAGSEVALVNSRFWFGDVLFHESSPVTGHAALNLVVRLPVN